MKSFIVVTAVLLGVGVCRAASLDAEFARWAEIKKADQQMAIDYSTTFKERGYNDNYVPVDKLFRAFERAMSSYQISDEAAQSRLYDAIDAKVSQGAIGAEKAQDLKSRVAKVFAARRYYAWGNFWRRCVIEGLGDDSPIPASDNAQQVLGKRLDLAISEETLARITRESAFDPAAYGIDSDYFHPQQIDLSVDLTARADDSRTKANPAALKKAGDRVNQTISEATQNQ